MDKLKNTAAHHARRLTQHRKVRFVLAGITNTAVDFLTFNVLIALLSVSIVPANIVSTTVAMACSYLLNKKAVFRNAQPHSLRQMILFLAVTLSGIWIVQTLIMVEVLRLLQNTFDAQSQSFLLWFLQNVAKAAGILVGAIWSYLGYSRLAFREHSEKKS